MKILLADDSAVARTLAAQLLTRWGHEVVSAHDGNEAMEALDSDDAPDLAILDWEMPGLTGPEVCARVKSKDEVQAPYLIMLTGRGADADARAALESGADDFLAKPFQPHDLRARVGLGARVVTLNRRLREQQAELDAIRQEMRDFRGDSGPGKE